MNYTEKDQVLRLQYFISNNNLKKKKAITSAYFDSIRVKSTAKQHFNETLAELKMIGNLIRMLQIFL